MTNPMAQAWLKAKEDLNIRVIHPFKFNSASGQEVETLGVYLPDFGGPYGMLLLCRFDSDLVYKLAEVLEYRSSGLNPDYYEPYDRELYIGTLSDWGWYGLSDQQPAWFDPNWRDKL